MLGRFPAARRLGLVAVLMCSAAPARAQVTIDFDTSFDSNNFFLTHPLAMTALQTAGQTIANRFGDTLTAIAPSGSNHWNIDTFNPSNPGASIQTADLTIAQNHVRVYVGGATLGGSELGLGGPGGFGASGSSAWLNTVSARGQAGALGPAASQTDFGPWGGSISFDQGTNWNFSTVTGPLPGQSDFLSVALHELGHLFGFGGADSFDNLVNTGTARFLGSSSTALNGGVNPPIYTGDFSHWAEGFSFGGQETVMDPTLTQGTRKLFTQMDFAGLRDIGWQVSAVPEPSTLLLAGVGGLGALSIRRRRKALAV